jgi:hypothetical protein
MNTYIKDFLFRVDFFVRRRQNDVVENGFYACYTTLTSLRLCCIMIILHEGIFRSDAKLMFSCGNDGTIIAWGSGGAVFDQVHVCLTFRVNIIVLGSYLG